MSSPPRRAALLAATVVAAGLSSAFAVAADPMTPKEVRISEGVMLSASCAACHGMGGAGSGSIPAIQGRPASEIPDALLRFRSGSLKGTVMNRIAAGFTPEQIAIIAGYYGGTDAQ